jgi:high-affinity iron transporter
MRRLTHQLVLLAALLVIAPAAAQAAAPAPWQFAAEARHSLAEAETQLALAGGAAAVAPIENARRAIRKGLAGAPDSAATLATIDAALIRGVTAARAEDALGLTVARAEAWTTLLAYAARQAIDAAARGDIATARSWLLVREFRPPTRFSRASADATTALLAVEKGALPAAEAARRIRTELLDSYQGLMRSELDDLKTTAEAGLDVGRAQAAALARGYFALLEPAYRKQRGAAAADRLVGAFDDLVTAAGARDDAATATAGTALDEVLLGFRAAPLAQEELVRRAAQVQRFLALVPVEYERGVSDGRVTKAFEIQEAITFRDSAAGAFADLESVLITRDAAATRQISGALETLGSEIQAAAHGTEVADPSEVERQVDDTLGVVERIFPSEWRDAAGLADFDVIRASLDRLELAVKAGAYGTAEQARLESYAFFEFGPEQRLRGLASGLFQTVEGYFWYGSDGKQGLAQLVARHAPPERIAETRAALDVALGEAEAAIGSGPANNTTVITNTAVIIFREGLEAVLILAVLTASMVGVQRRLRRPLFVGAFVALAASAVTWVIAQTILAELNRYGEKLSAVVGLIAIAVLLLILNWFFHKVYWTDHLSGLHQKKRRIVNARTGFLASQAVGLALLGFTSVYREGFETVLFLQAITLESSVPVMLVGVLIGFAATAVVGILTFKLQTHLPYRRMLMVTGLMVAWVLVVMTGSTVQIMQKVGWLPISPVDGLSLPYWSGLWFGLYPTWQGIGLQLAGLTFVIGSYLVVEWQRRRRRERVQIGPEPAASLAPPRAAAHADSKLTSLT